MTNLSIVLPTYNEKDNIIDLINKIKDVVKNHSHEIIVVDDNSPDDTFEVCKKYFIDDENIKMILRKANHGLAYSIREGIENAKGEYVVIMDTDFTHDPDLIKQMLNMNTKYNIISGSRFCKGGSMESTMHSILSRVYNKMIKFILQTKIEDNLGGFFCIKHKNLMQLPFEKIFYGYGDYYFRLLYFAKQKNFSIVEIPARYTTRTRGKSKSKFFQMAYKYFVEVIKLKISS